MERPQPDPVKLLDAWMEWERGETPPGRVMANLKTGGLRDLLEALAAGASDKEGKEAEQADLAAESWQPVV